MSFRSLPAALLAALLAAPAPACDAGGVCVAVAPTTIAAREAALAALGVRPGAVPAAPAPAVAVGDVLDRGRYSLLLNADYYGLPRAADGTVYMRVGRDLFRVDWRSHEVLERVTERAGANF